jgi:hypothetical protein
MASNLATRLRVWLLLIIGDGHGFVRPALCPYKEARGKRSNHQQYCIHCTPMPMHEASRPFVTAITFQTLPRYCSRVLNCKNEAVRKIIVFEIGSPGQTVWRHWRHNRRLKIRQAEWSHPGGGPAEWTNDASNQWQQPGAGICAPGGKLGLL